VAAEVVIRSLEARPDSIVTMALDMARNVNLGLKPEAIRTRLGHSQNTDQSSCDSLRSSGVLIA